MATITYTATSDSVTFSLEPTEAIPGKNPALSALYYIDGDLAGSTEGVYDTPIITTITGLTTETTYTVDWVFLADSAVIGQGTTTATTLPDEPITATQAQWADLIDRVKTLQTGKVNAKKIQGSTSGVVYRKVTVVGGSSVYDGVGILLFSREQRFLIDGMTATGYNGRCIEIGTNSNGTTATTSNRLINLKVYGVPESSRVEIYCRMSPYVYIDVHSTGTITIEESTESAYNSATNNSTYKSLLNRGDTIPETDVIWDGNTVKKDGELTPTTMGCLDEFGHNRLAYLPPACLSFAFSRDGGSTWLDYTTANGADFTPTDAQKTQFVTYGNVWFAAGGRLVNDSSTVANERLRIRIAAWKNKTGSQAIYGQLKQLIVNMTSEGSGGTQCTIRYRTLANFKNNVETWVTYGSGYGLSGWSGWNSIPYRRRFGGSSTQTTQDGEIELVFWQTSVNSSSKKNMKVGALRAISSNLWTSPSDMASTGRLYSITDTKRAIFPEHIQLNDLLALNVFNRDASGNYGKLGKSDAPWKALYVSDGLYNGDVHLNLPTTEGTLALSSEIPTKVSELQNDSGYTTNTGTITKVQANGTDVASSGTANIPAASTSAYGVTKLSDSVSSTSTSLAATANAVKSAYDLAASKGTGTITKVQANGTDVASSGTANIPAASTSAYGVTKLSTSTSSTSTSLAATPSAVKSAYDLANGKQDALVSGTNIKTINNTSILGSGNISISTGTTYTAGDNITISSQDVIDTAATVPLIGSTLSSATSAYVDTDNIVNGAVTPTKLAWTEIIDKIYPIGSIYMSATLSTASAVGEVLGGTWVAWGAGKVPVGVDTSDTDFDTVEEIGGSKTHNHQYGIWTSGWYGMIGGIGGGDTVQLYNGSWTAGTTTSGGNQTISANPPTGASNAAASTKRTTNTTNGSTLQPYITCYMYKRTA